jgi:hypothetical protein
MPDAISMPNLPRLLLSSLDFKKAVIKLASCLNLQRGFATMNTIFGESLVVRGAES